MIARFYQVITDFKRTDQPIYLYRLNDIFGGRKVSALVVPSLLESKRSKGRSDDIFISKEDGSNQVIYQFIRRSFSLIKNVGLSSISWQMDPL